MYKYGLQFPLHVARHKTLTGGPKLQLEGKQPKHDNHDTLHNRLAAVKAEAQIIWEVFHSLVKSVKYEGKMLYQLCKGEFFVNQCLQM